MKSSPEKLAREKARYWEKRDAVLARSKAAYAEEPEKFRALSRERRKKEPEIVRARVRAAYRKRADHYKERQVSITANRRARIRGAAGKLTEAEWQAILRAHGNRCAKCGTKGRLHRDHIVPLALGGCNFAFNIQPLCRDCNFSKRAKLETPVVSLFDGLR